ncbi:hypothetical protein J6590_065665 [Homalodisca vitripennis]|nr:hypothetical protein J6590_065657 [Homalodisca vitripennis]KAG8286205.1 hypothetical protein J6590_065665 [Homalodisca vitripennis]
MDKSNNPPFKALTSLNATESQNPRKVQTVQRLRVNSEWYFCSYRSDKCNKKMEEIKVWQELESLLLQLQNRQGLPDSSLFTNNTYSIDEIKLY